MKFFLKSFLLISVALLAFVAILITILLFSPGLQRGLVLKGLESRAGVIAELEHLRFGWNKAEIRGLQVSVGEERLSLASLEARYSLWDLIKSRARIDQLIVEGLHLDVSASGGAQLAEAFSGTDHQDPPDISSNGPEPAPRTNFSEIPGVPITIGQIRIEGTARIPGDLKTVFAFRLDGLKPGQTGDLSLTALVEASGDAPLFQRAEGEVTGRIKQTTSGSFDHLEAKTFFRFIESDVAQPIEIRTQAIVQITPSDLSAILEEVVLFQGSNRLLQGGLQATGKRVDDQSWLLDYSARITADLATLSRLEMLDLDSPLSGGSLQAEASGEIGERITLKGRLEVLEIRPPDQSGEPYSLEFRPEADYERHSGKLALTAPFRLGSPGSVTNGSLSARLDADASGSMEFDVDLTADSLILDEWLPLLSILPEQGPEVERDPQPDSQPPWARLSGEIRTRLGLLKINDQSLTHLAATVRIENGERVATDITAQSGDSPFNANALLVFSPEDPINPYRLTGRLEAQRFEVTPILKATPASQPILEGSFNMVGSFQSMAPNLAFLGDLLTGEFVLTSAGSGVFRPLGDRTHMAQGVSGLLGILSGSVKELGWTQMVIDQLKEIPYTQMTFNIERDQNLDWVLRNLDLISRETRIRGQGTIQHQDNQDFLRLPINMRFDLFAKGKLAEALRTGNQLRSNEPDSLGYFQGPPLPLRGSLGSPESLIINLLMESGQQLLPGLLGPRRSAPTGSEP